jgi:transcriptional regulator with XRE-family HTH domain
MADMGTFPNGRLNTGAANQFGAGLALRVLAEAARALHFRRYRAGWSQEALARRNPFTYRDAVSRVETGSEWVDLATLTNVLDAANLRLRVVDKDTGEPPSVGESPLR